MKFNIYQGRDRRHYTLPFHLPEGKRGQWRVTVKEHKVGEKLTIVSMRNAIFMGLKPASAICDRPIYTHWLEQRGGGRNGTWMTSMPQEIEQHERQLKNFHGDVLVGGLGLGVAVALLDRNPRVESIMVVELSKSVIDLVHPHVPETKALFVIQQCLYKRLRELKKLKVTFDCAFFDIWCPTGQSVLDEHVIPLRRLSRDIISQDKIECWNESEMIGQVRMSVSTAVQFYEANPRGHHPLLLCEQETFESPSLKRAHGCQWTFLNWLRNEKPSVKQAQEKSESFLQALSNPIRFDAEWKQYA